MMKRCAAVMVVAGLVFACKGPSTSASPTGEAASVPLPVARVAGPQQPLPAPRASGPVSVEEALARRRSVRSFARAPLAETALATLLWAAQGQTDHASGGRTAPSAGALYPLELYVATADGLFHYAPAAHALERIRDSDLRPALAHAALDQEAPLRAPAVIVIVGHAERTRTRYGDRAERYVAMEAGHAAQNVLLEATALGLGAVPIGAVDERLGREALGLGDDATPFYLVPVGAQAE